MRTRFGKETDKQAISNIYNKLLYGSEKVQAQKGTDAWTIEVEKGKREAYLTVTKKAWYEATDKDAYAATEHLYQKVNCFA